LTLLKAIFEVNVTGLPIAILYYFLVIYDVVVINLFILRLLDRHIS